MDASDFGAPASAADFGAPAGGSAPAASSAADAFGAPAAPPHATDFGAPKGSAPAPFVPQRSTPGGAPLKGIPTDYDTIIEQAAIKHGIPFTLLKAVGWHESNLGKGANYDAKTGTDKDGNAGHGLWQLDPASGASAATLARAAKDPAFAADYAAGMLSAGLKRHGGDVRTALMAYNAGDGGAAQGVGAGYAKTIMASMDQMGPVPNIAHSEPVAHAKKFVKRIVAAQRAGKDPVAAAFRDPWFHSTAKITKAGQQATDYVRRHPVEGLVDFFGAGQHAVGEALHEYAVLRAAETDAVQHHRAWDSSAAHRQALDAISRAVFHPNARTMRESAGGLGEAINAATGHHVWQSNDDIDAFVRAHGWIPSWAAGTLKGTNDFVQQTLTDPLSLVPIGKVVGFAGRALHASPAGAVMSHALGSAAGIMRAAHAVLPAKAARSGAFDFLRHAADQVHEQSDRLFGVRRDLDHAGFTARGKQARIGMENAYISRHATDVNTARRVAGDAAAAAQHFARMAARTTSYGQGAGARGATNLARHIGVVSNRATSAADRLKYLEAMAKTARVEGLAAETQRTFGAAQHLFTGTAQDLAKVGTHEQSSTQRFLDASKPLTGALADLGKRAIMWNFIPHGVKNVGSLVFNNGGLGAIMHGIGSMLPGTLTPADVARLHSMGAMTDYIAGDVKHLTKVDAALYHASQAALERVELGWRAGVMRHLDATMGKPQTKVDEYIRGYLINKMVGDYRNRSNFTKVFAALGGPFVAFRAGIVPEMLLRTARTHPERIARQAYIGDDTQRERGPGKSHNTLELGGPVLGDGANILAGIENQDPRYLAQTIGLAYDALESPKPGEEGSATRWAHVALNVLGMYFPVLNAASHALPLATGSERPGQHVTLAQQLEDTILDAFGAYYRKNQKPQAARAEMRRIQKGPA